jgi:ABC-type lipoprotein export system ATPase subunit
MPDTQPAVQLDHISRHYKMGESFVRAVDDVSLSVGRGEYLALLGSSGSGKSTLLNLIAGLDRPTAGAIVANGANLAALSPLELARYRRNTIGMIFQSFNLLPRMTLEENVDLPLRLAEVERSERAGRVREALERVRLTHRTGHRPSELSGGEQQRVAIARALAHQPAVLLADEPTGNLDEETASQVLRVLLSSSKSRGTTLIIVTHDAWLARSADRILELHEGKLATARTPARRTGRS